MIKYEVKVCESVRWLLEKLYPRRKVLLDAMKMGISLHDIIVESQFLLAIICSWISPCTNMTYVPIMRARMVTRILENISFNVLDIMLLDIRYFKNKGGS